MRMMMIMVMMKYAGKLHRINTIGNIHSNTFFTQRN